MTIAIVKGWILELFQIGQKSVKIENHKSALEVIPPIQTHYKLHG